MKICTDTLHQASVSYRLISHIAVLYGKAGHALPGDRTKRLQNKRQPDRNPFSAPVYVSPHQEAFPAVDTGPAYFFKNAGSSLLPLHDCI